MPFCYKTRPKIPLYFSIKSRIFIRISSLWRHFAMADNNHDAHAHTHTHPFNGPFFGTTQVSRYQKGKTNLDFTEARDSEWQWLQLGHVQVCTSLQTDNHASTPPLSFLQAGCSSCHLTNSIKVLKACLHQSPMCTCTYILVKLLLCKL